jgi:hypothetical protein
MNIVTVTFDRDFDQLLLQADSINKYLTTKTTHWVVVESTSKLHQEWKDRLAPFYTFHELKLMFFGDFESPNTGYQRQQILKFLISTYIQDDFYLVLDCKNFLVKETALTFDLDEEGNRSVFDNSKEYFTHFSPYWFDQIQTSIKEELNVPIPNKFWGINTPYRMKSVVSRKIVSMLNLSNFFYRNRSVFIDFFLYRLFTNYPVENSRTDQIYITLWPDLANVGITKGNIIKTLNQIKDTETIVFLACHRDWIKNYRHIQYIDMVKKFLYTTTILDKTLIDNYFLIK